MTPYKTNEANILYSVRQNNISNNNFQIADTCTHCVPIFKSRNLSCCQCEDTSLTIRAVITRVNGHMMFYDSKTVSLIKNAKGSMIIIISNEQQKPVYNV